MSNPQDLSKKGGGNVIGMGKLKFPDFNDEIEEVVNQVMSKGGKIMGTSIEFQDVSKGNWLITKAIGRIDTTNASVAEKALMKSLEKARNLALDMSQLEYTSSAGLRVMLRIGKKAKKEKKQFVFCGVQGMVKEILEDSGTDLLFTIYESTENLK